MEDIREITLLESMELRKRGISNPYKYIEDHSEELANLMDQINYEGFLSMKGGEEIWQMET